MKYLFPAVLLGSFVIAGCNPVDIPTSTPTPMPTLVFPTGSALTDQENIDLRGSVADGVQSIVVNGVAATLDHSTDTWTVNIPLVSGANVLDIQATLNGGTQAVETDTVITRNDPFIYDFPLLSAYDSASKLMYINDRNTDQIIALNTDTLERTVIFSNKNPDQKDAELDYIDEPIAISADGQTLYLTGSKTNDDNVLLSISVTDGTISYLVDGTHADYALLESLSPSTLVMDSAREALYIGGWQANQKPLVYDVSSGELSALAIDDISTITGAGSPRPELITLLSDSTLSVSGERSGGFYSLEIDLSSCDGQADCTLSTSNATTSFDASNCLAPQNSHDHVIDADGKRLVYYRYDGTISADMFCTLDLQTGTIERIFAEYVDETDSTNAFTVAGNQFYYFQDYVIDRLTMPDGSGTPIPAPTNVYSLPQVGSDIVDMTTPRQVVVDDATEAVFWMDRNDGEIYRRLDGTWSLHADLSTQGSASPEKTALNPATNELYILEDNNRLIIYTVNASTGAIGKLLELADSGNPYDINDIDAIALDAANQVVYLAVEFEWGSVPDGYGRKGLAKLNISSGEITLIAGATDDENFDDRFPSYDMVFDAENDRVLFYNSGGDPSNPIIAIDINDGTRWVFSADIMFIDPISTTNARGHAMDSSNDRMLCTSQDSQSVFAIDLDTGMRSYVSESSTDNGVLLRQPKGIDILDAKSIAYVADEGIDALYEVDLTSGERVIIQR